MISNENRRRIRTYSRRLAAMVGGSLKHPCFFMHIPKCGGTSISEALAATIPMSDRVGVIDANATRRGAALIHADQNELHLYHDDLDTADHVYALREQMLLMHMAWDTELIFGHVPFSTKADRHFGGQYKYATILREPYARLVSNYNGSVSHGLIDMPFSDYLETDIAQRHALTGIRYFTNRHDLDAATAEQAIPEALEVAKKFSVIGHLENLDRFCRDFEDVFGRRPKVFRYNEARQGAYRPNEAEKVRAMELLAPDIALWELIREIDAG